MEIRETTLSFPVVRGSGPSIASATVVFPREVVGAVAAVRGYQIGFAGEDHHIGLLEVALDTTTDLNAVTIQGRLGSRDWSGYWDDNYGGTIQVSLLAELASTAEPAPRGDLLVTEMEVSQAVQFFHAADHLDSGNVRPNNSIPLVAGKDLGLRAWVDYDASAGLPAISALTGELVVRSGGATATFTARESITPRRSTEIDRGSASHTLNFLIPGAWCEGSIDISLRVFDASAPGQKSGALRRSFRFVRVNPLRVYGVGVNYTGAGLDLVAPQITDFSTTFDYTRRVWPTGELQFSGYTTIQFSGDLSGVASEGCGDGFGDLLDELHDIQGDTDDLVYGLLPSGTPLSGVAGCGGSGAGAGRNNDGVTAAHEAGHAVGRQHAPCDDPARCDNPNNTDDHFPRYGAYVSDSVGEFGYDVAANRVFDPATARDFMGYSTSNWISPYTYTALMAKGDPSPPGGAARAELFIEGSNEVEGPAIRPEWRKQREQVLFLRVHIDGDAIEVRPSFTYSAYRRAVGTATRYEAKVLDAENKLIACVHLLSSQISCGCCGAADLYGQVPISGSPVRLVICRSGKEISEVDFEVPPKITAEVEAAEEGQVRIRCHAEDGDETPVWYLLQWQDRDGTWRGVTPRTRETEILLPEYLMWATRRHLQLQLLAVKRLSTTSKAIRLETTAENPPIELVVYDTPTTATALIVDPLGRQVPAKDIVWYDEHGGEVGRGDHVFTEGLTSGAVRVVPEGLGVTATEGTILINRNSTEAVQTTKGRAEHLDSQLQQPAVVVDEKKDEDSGHSAE
jgi:hypothetical protein